MILNLNGGFHLANKFFPKKQTFFKRLSTRIPFLVCMGPMHARLDPFGQTFLSGPCLPPRCPDTSHLRA